ncbi:MAG: hypothetical protein L3J11_09400 [Draconibacterium sp.]|nr:hypothetical protein [Draconibacterium sp.]
MGKKKESMESLNPFLRQDGIALSDAIPCKQTLIVADSIRLTERVGLKCEKYFFTLNGQVNFL